MSTVAFVTGSVSHWGSSPAPGGARLPMSCLCRACLGLFLRLDLGAWLLDSWRVGSLARPALLLDRWRVVGGARKFTKFQKLHQARSIFWPYFRRSYSSLALR